MSKACIILITLVTAVATNTSSGDAIGKDFAKASPEELAVVDSQLADAFEAYAKAPEAHDHQAVWIQASEVFRARAKDEAHVTSAGTTSRELSAAVASAEDIAIAKLNVLAQHAPLPRIRSLYRAIALVFVERAELDNPVKHAPMTFLAPTPDLIIPKDLQ
jgi:hypothetical protein